MGMSGPYPSAEQRGKRRPMALVRALVVLLVLPFAVGCGLFKQLQVDNVSVSSQEPSNVAAYISVSDGDEPVTDLTEQNFNIYENEQLISPAESKQKLLDRNLVAVHHVLFLVDVSSAKEDGTRAALSRAVAGFVGHARASQGVTVYAFDGGAEPKLIGDYPKGGTGPNDIAELAQQQSADPSRNLHGAVIFGLKELGARLMREQKPIRVGTLVVLTAGVDLAGRATLEQMQQAVDASSYQIVAIGVGDENSFDLGGLGKAGTLWAPSLGGTGPVLDDTASRVESLLEHFYLLAYCSPARAGQRHLRIEVVHMNKEGDERKGNLDADFDATGFGPGCDPGTTPRFGAGSISTEPEEGAEAGEETKAGDKGEPKKGDAKKGDAKPSEPKKGEAKPAGDGKKGEGDSIVPPPATPGYAPVPKE
jgi:hypothetical protein